MNNDRLSRALVLIDGVSIPHVASYRVRSDGCFRIDADNAASQLGAADGYWILLKPLPIGHHTISVGANYDSDVRDYDSDERDYGKMVQFFEYDLDVGGQSI